MRIVVKEGIKMNLNHVQTQSHDRVSTARSTRLFRRGHGLRAGFAAMVLLGLGLVAGQAKAGDILDVIDHDPAYSTFSALLRKTGMASDLKAGAGYTVFVPSNAAFNDLPAEQRQRLLDSDSATARRAIASLVVAKKYLPQDVAHNRLLLKSVDGQGLVIDGTEGRLTADGTEILSVDTSPSNGVIYTIDGVSLSPQNSGRDSD
jgi:uncharacterized surface protein with fasciclin (FAS1) repeats